MRTHFYRRPGAVDRAKQARTLLAEALDLCHRAELLLNESGHKRAAWGIHQAAARVRSWLGKLTEDITRSGL